MIADALMADINDVAENKVINDNDSRKLPRSSARRRALAQRRFHLAAIYACAWKDADVYDGFRSIT